MPMQSNLSKSLTKNLKKILDSLRKVDKLPKAIIKYGFIIFLALLAAGTLILVHNRISGNYDFYWDFTATTLVKNSFTILAEAVIGGLLIDFIFKKE